MSIGIDIGKHSVKIVELDSANGQVEVKKIDQGYRYPGTHIVNIDGRNLPTGIYFYQLRAGDFIETKKMSLIK